MNREPSTVLPLTAHSSWTGGGHLDYLPNAIRDNHMTDNQSSIGLRAKTGRAIAVVLAGPPHSPRVLRRVELSLIDPRVPGTFQPYHEVMDLPWEKGQIAVRKFARAIERIAARALAQLVKKEHADGNVVCGVGIVGAPDRQLEKIGSPHIRAHAAEGVLFRHVLETAATENQLDGLVFAERDFDQLAATELQITAEQLGQQLKDLGRSIGQPWRTEEKKATAAAWLALRSFGNSRNKTRTSRRK